MKTNIQKTFATLCVLCAFASKSAAQYNTAVMTDGGGNLVNSLTVSGTNRLTISGTANISLAANAVPWSALSKSGASLADLPVRNFADLQNKPTTLAGYGITDSAASPPLATTASAGVVSVGQGLAVQSGSLSVSPNINFIKSIGSGTGYSEAQFSRFYLGDYAASGGSGWAITQRANPATMNIEADDVLANAVTITSGSVRTVQIGNWFTLRVGQAVGNFTGTFVGSGSGLTGLPPPPLATGTSAGIVSVGSNLTVSGGTVALSGTLTNLTVSGTFNGSFNGDLHGAGGALLWGSAQGASELVDANGNTVITYTTDSRYLADRNSGASIEFNYRIAFDSSQVVSIDWTNRSLLDGGGNEVVQWAYKQLMSGGVVLDWREKEMFDSSSNPALNWEYRELIANNAPVLNWSSGTAVGTFGGVFSGVINLPPESDAAPAQSGNAGDLCSTITSGSAALWFHDGAGWKKVQLVNP